MNIFNSLGSSYNFSFVLQSLKKSKKKSLNNLEKNLEKKYKGKVVLTYKGRQAIELALKLSKIEEGSKVAVTGFTCIAVIEAIEKNNLTPVYLDIDSESLNFSAHELESKIKLNREIKAVIIQNTLGYPCDIERISRVCKKHKLILIEDLAHSIGTVYKRSLRAYALKRSLEANVPENGVEAGTVGDYVCLSFSQDKAIDAVSGGALIIKNLKYNALESKPQNDKRALQDRAYPLITFFIRSLYQLYLGKILHRILNMIRVLNDPMSSPSQQCMTDWHAGLASYGFKNLGMTLKHRRRIARIYADHLPTEVTSSEINKLTDLGTNLRFPIFIANRNKLVKYLKSRGVYVSDIWYDGVVAPVKYLGLSKYPKASCPNAEKVSKMILNLPTHINVSEKDAYETCKIITQYVNS